MEKNIVKNGTKVILFALGDWLLVCHYKELDGNLQRRNFEIIPNKFINHTITLNNGYARVEFSNFCCGISTVFYGEIGNLPEPGTCQQWY